MISLDTDLGKEEMLKKASEKVYFEENCLETESELAILSQNLKLLQIGLGGETGGHLSCCSSLPDITSPTHCP